VASDDRRGLLHFVYRDGDALRYHLLLAPDGEVWTTAATDTKQPNFHPFVGFYMRTRNGVWQEPARLSPEGAVNMDARWDQTPRLVLHRGKVRIFYAEAPSRSGSFSFLQRVFE
jgi:hypothetical protein